MSFRLAPALSLLLLLPLVTAQTITLNFGAEQLIEQGAKLNAAAAQELEATVEKNPNDLTARAKLLGYYYYQWMQPGEVAAKAARRRHILWLIDRQPEAPVTGVNEAVLDRAGNALSDEEGYDQARKLWLGHFDSPTITAAALGNLARFFQMTDKNLAEKALLRARVMQPQNGEWNWRLGYLYAMGILGVDGLGLNGQPTSVDPFAQQGPFAARSRKALAESTNGTMLAIAASIIWRYGTMLAPSEKVKVDYVDMAIQFVQQARSAEPANPSWPQFLAQLQAYRRQVFSPAN
jgi:hypothetical protein